MKTAFTVTLCVLLVFFSACSQKVNDPADVQAIKKSMDDFAKAASAGDAAGIAALMTDKTVYADGNVPVAVGKGAILVLNQAWFGQFNAGFSTPVEDVRVTGDSAVARGTWDLKGASKAQGLAPLTDSGSWIVTFARQSDGSWKWDSVVANSNQPLPGSTATGEDEKALLQLERDWAEASVKKDVAALDKILANNFQANYDDFVGNKKQILADMKSGRQKVESETNSEMKAFVFGDAAVVNGVVTVKASAGGKDTSGRWRYTDVFAKRDGRWQCVTGYSAKIQ
jgi:ketosteroid isomerase-like protein